MNNRTHVLVTGANGFVGHHLVAHLASRGFKVTAASRKPLACDIANVTRIPLPDLSAPLDWSPLIRQCNAVVHLAGIAHKRASVHMYDLVNHRTTAALAEAAFQCGTDHLIFISSIAAQCGSFSHHESKEDDAPRPTNAYGRSKLAAENAVRASGASFTILRPVVIYGEGEKGNFAAIHKISRTFLPLPFGAMTALRSVLSIRNFCSAVEMVMANPKAKGETFVVADPTAVTIGELIARYRAGMGRSPGLLPIPEKWLKYFLIAFGQRTLWERIGCPLIAYPTKLLEAGWDAPENF
jgi:nucleoside-diphosphate-sugar epimerase